MGLTDKALEILLGALILGLAILLVEQETTLHHDLSTADRALAIEQQCRVGSVCAQKLSNEAARGDAMTQQAKADAAAEIAAKKAELDKQAAAAVQGLETQNKATSATTINWKKRYQELLASPDCEAWSRQAVACAIR